MVVMPTLQKMCQEQDQVQGQDNRKWHQKTTTMINTTTEAKAKVNASMLFLRHLLNVLINDLKTGERCAKNKDQVQGQDSRRWHQKTTSEINTTTEAQAKAKAKARVKARVRASARAKARAKVKVKSKILKSRDCDEKSHSWLNKWLESWGKKKKKPQVYPNTGGSPPRSDPITNRFRDPILKPAQLS